MFLCCCLASQSSDHAARTKTSRKGKRKSSNSDATMAGCTLGHWNYSTFCSRSSDTLKQVERGRSKAMQAAKRLYKQMMYQEGAGALVRACSMSLQALLTQLRSSPFALVRRQSMSGLSA